jgi:hypothetical protein
MELWNVGVMEYWEFQYSNTPLFLSIYNIDNDINTK